MAKKEPPTSIGDTATKGARPADDSLESQDFDIWDALETLHIQYKPSFYQIHVPKIGGYGAKYYLDLDLNRANEK
eukprot:7295705-Ditylum_brightwellii.AAC.1